MATNLAAIEDEQVLADMVSSIYEKLKSSNIYLVTKDILYS